MLLLWHVMNALKKEEKRKLSNLNEETNSFVNKNDTFNGVTPRAGRPEQIAERFFEAYRNKTDKHIGCTTDNFERKCMLILERCDQADITEGERHKLFSNKIIGTARQYYFDYVKIFRLNLNELGNTIKARFKTSKRSRLRLENGTQ